MSRRSPAALCVILLALVVAHTGCATRIRNIPTQPLVKQTNGAAERDFRECEAAITGQLKGVWFPAEIEFASCMIARNYLVYVQLLDASVEVRKASVKAKIPPAQIQEHLVTCERTASKNLTWAEKIGRPVVAVAGAFFWPVSVGGMAASATLAVNRQRDYADCMTPLGYVVTVWQPRPEDPTFRAASEERVSP
jgi:hypothetical protein